MRSRWTTLVFVLMMSLTASAQQGDKEKFKARYEALPSDADFDRHDLSGIWTQTKLDHSLGTPVPPLTPAGIAAMNGRIQDRPGVIGNAPWYTCNPMGFPRLMNDDEPMEFIITRDRILQVFQWEHRIRYLWTDGRTLPSGENLENLGPAWYGHSVGKWEGNKLIVNTVGLEERAWLDNAAHPKSFHARIEETWERVDSNTLENQLTLYDPEYYTAPWVSAKPQVFKLQLPIDRSIIGEEFCVPSEEEFFNENIRNLAGAGKKVLDPK